MTTDVTVQLTMVALFCLVIWELFYLTAWVFVCVYVPICMYNVHRDSVCSLCVLHILSQLAYTDVPLCVCLFTCLSLCSPVCLLPVFSCLSICLLVFRC